MEQSLELMRKSRASYIKLIAEHSIHKVCESYDKLHELFSIFGVQVDLKEDGSGRITQCPT